MKKFVEGLLRTASFVAVFALVGGIVLMSVESGRTGNWIVVISGAFFLVLEYVVLLRDLIRDTENGKFIPVLFLTLLIYGGLELVFFLGFDFTITGQVSTLMRGLESGLGSIISSEVLFASLGVLYIIMGTASLARLGLLDDEERASLNF